MTCLILIAIILLTLPLEARARATAWLQTFPLPNTELTCLRSIILGCASLQDAMHDSLLDIKFPPRSKGGVCNKLYEALQATF
jgi:hypothetical protein